MMTSTHLLAQISLMNRIWIVLRRTGLRLSLAGLLGLMAFTATTATAADLILDNGSVAFSVVGDWPVSTAVAGYRGTNYQTHIAHGQPPGAITVDNTAAGFSVTGDWSLSTAVAGYLGSNYRTHDANGAKPGSTVIDNAGATVTGTWPLSTSVAGYLGSNYQTHAAGTGQNRFTWPLAGNGQYRVYVRWTANPNRATNAPYMLRHSTGEDTITVNQQANGGAWQLLGTYTLDANSQLSLSDAANGYVIADAVMAVPLNAAPNTATWALSIETAQNYRVYARWSAHPNRASNALYTIRTGTGEETVSVNQQQNGGIWQLLGTYALTPASQVSLSDAANGYVIADAVMAVPEASGANRAIWSPGLSEAGTYEVFAQWTANPNRATNAPYTIHHRTGDTTVTVNQQQNGGRWQLLGRFDLVPGSTVALSDDADGYVIADALRLSKVIDSAPQIYYLHTDQINTPRLVTDEQNTIVWRNNPLAEPFGMSPPDEDPDGDGTKFVMNLRFPGQYADKETNTNYNYYRDYDPEIGRYIESDPIGLGGGINTYSYVGGSPLGEIDPEGLYSEIPLTDPSFFGLTTTSGLQTNTTLNQAIAAGALTRNITMPAVAGALTPNAIGLVGVSILPAASLCSAAPAANMNLQTMGMLGQFFRAGLNGNWAGVTQVMIQMAKAPGGTAQLQAIGVMASQMISGVTNATALSALQSISQMAQSIARSGR